MSNIKKLLKKVAKSIVNFFFRKDETELLALGTLLSNQQLLMNSSNINDYEFKIFSQFGDDGIIQYLIKHIKIENEIFIEFGVENYLESNTRFLMMNNNWSGFVMDGSQNALNELQNQKWYWKYSLTNKAVFIDKDNIDGLLADTGFSNIGLLHIDLDGNDYHVFEAINLSKLNPAIVIFEYNSAWGTDRAISVPYDKNFIRFNAHYSNLYWGASLKAFDFIASKRGYALVGCNLAGNNAYFVRRDLLNDRVRALTVEQAHKVSKYRESRNKDFSLSYLTGDERLRPVKGLDVLNVETNVMEKL